ncbi:hypothetical protein [Streptomyces malaysiensis]|uniref:hypothetical protein n=1 Tax=Streptomyces malaysiensis TaxID=92644 RepID=UPI000BFC67ED|nr:MULTISPECIES: hypothetical protein [Streptomyces]ATL86402.1 hypothetical protein SMALA_6174 [Streptomyces malaysiensis]AUA10345.1 hypothetical protein CFP59_02444 [Streptomyces sp. M56]MCC4314864.1 hypothetical protein [Streptomyces malaysiensis]MYX57291.1 hypothetical protein [Streptomyces sp. SID8382]QDL70024.1 hypothetical protein DNK48_12050 [Streptomyces malaysiensis]
MIDVILPELPERELALMSEEKPQPSGPRLAGRVILGGPVALPVTTELVGPDPELLDFLRTEADNAVYHLVHLSVTCARDAPDPALHSVNLDVTLTAEPVRRGTAVFQPVAWSMTPRQLTADAKATTPAHAAHLGPRLGFHDGARTAYGERICLEARRELRSDPGWEIRHTSAVRIGGTYRLAMVVRAPRGAVSRAAVAVGATVREGHTLHRFREELDEPLRLAALQ